MPQPVNTIDREKVETIANKNGEPAWLRETRVSAWESYLQTPTPSMRDEEWRKVDLDALDMSTLNMVDLCSESQEKPEHPLLWESINEYFPERAAVVFDVDKSACEEGLSSSLASKGVIFCSLRKALKNHADLVRPYLANALTDSKFVSMNKALFDCGTFLYVPAGLELALPFISITEFGAANPDAAHVAVFPRIIVVLGENSRANLINVFSSSAEEPSDKPHSLANALVEINLEPNAKLDYLELQDFDSNIFAIARTENSIRQGAELNSLTVALGAAQLKGDVVTKLEERGASSKIYGIVLGEDNEHFNFNTIQRHNAPDTQSQINFRVVLKDSSVSVYQGTIEVAKVAQRIEAFQSNKNLLLGSKAHADSIPRLEILADDVKCSHGATVGPVDREQIFYLQSRGLSAPLAEELIVTGFFRQILESCQIGRAKEWVYELLADKIHGK